MTAEPSRPVAVVSGSATGIGAACARRLASHGFNVLINYTRSAGEAEKAAARCREAGAEVAVVQGDVSEDDACRKLVDEAVGRWGAVDVLVNNAGRRLLALGLEIDRGADLGLLIRHRPCHPRSAADRSVCKSLCGRGFLSGPNTLYSIHWRMP